jgi:hypothetical protein
MSTSPTDVEEYSRIARKVNIDLNLSPRLHWRDVEKVLMGVGDLWTKYDEGWASSIESRILQATDG